jgi:hypothetical protein
VGQALWRKATGQRPQKPTLPGPEITATLPPRPKDLVRAYVRHVGGDPSTYRGRLPPHLFPQWGFPLASRTLIGIDYPLQKIMNAGCRVEALAPLPDHEPLQVRARLQSVDENERRAILQFRIITGTRSAPDAVHGDIFALIALGKKKRPDGPGGDPQGPKKKEPVRVPSGAKEIGFWRLGSTAGLDFAKLTGDFNPVHWIPAYAKMFGFRNCILHGFSTMARAMEGLNRSVLAGAADQIQSFDTKFTRPLVLPAQVGLYLAEEHKIYVGDGPGSRAYLEGSFELEPSP